MFLSLMVNHLNDFKIFIFSFKTDSRLRHLQKTKKNERSNKWDTTSPNSFSLLISILTWFEYYINSVFFQELCDFITSWKKLFFWLAILYFPWNWKFWHQSLLKLNSKIVSVGWELWESNFWNNALSKTVGI